MAKRNDTSKKRPSNNPAVLTGSPVANDRNELHRQALHEAIEAKRTRLSQAQSTLECLILALKTPIKATRRTRLTIRTSRSSCWVSCGSR